MNDGVVFAFIYVVALTWMLRYALSHPIMSDRAIEYNAFNGILQGKPWLRSTYGVISSSIMVTLVPCLAYRLLVALRWKGSSELVFKVAPCICYALAPAFVYLTARQYLDVGLSVITCLFLFTHFSLLYAPNTGRVGVGIGFLSGMVWSLLTGQIILASAFAVLVVFSHYGVAYQLLFALGFTWGVLSITGIAEESFIAFSILLLIFLVTIEIWYMRFIKVVGAFGSEFVEHSLSLQSRTLTVPRVSSAMGLGHSSLESMLVATESLPVQVGASIGTRLRNFFRLSHREPPLQVMLGRGFRQMETPRKIEVLVTWVMVLMVTAGVVITCSQGFISGLHMVLAGAMMSTIAIAIVVPHVSVLYGVGRTYLAVLTVVAPCFVVVTSRLSTVFGAHEYVLPLFLVGFYAFCVSGQIHWIFGVDKRATQRWMESIVYTDEPDAQGRKSY